jgi:hypothetical protein
MILGRGLLLVADSFLGCEKTSNFNGLPAVFNGPSSPATAACHGFRASVRCVQAMTRPSPVSLSEERIERSK